jgi:hypothetical protein
MSRGIDGQGEEHMFFPLRCRCCVEKVTHQHTDAFIFGIKLQFDA